MKAWAAPLLAAAVGMFSSPAVHLVTRPSTLAAAGPTLDSLRVELVRARGFNRASETQLSKVLLRFDAMYPATQRTAALDAMRADLVSARGFIRAEETQLNKTVVLTDTLLVLARYSPTVVDTGVVILPRTVELTVGDSLQLCALHLWSDGTATLEPPQDTIHICQERLHDWTAQPLASPVPPSPVYQPAPEDTAKGPAGPIGGAP